LDKIIKDRRANEEKPIVRPAEQWLTDIANNTLNFFEEVGESARASLKGSISGPSVSSLAVINTLTADLAAKTIRNISEDARRDLVQLAAESPSVT
jgi:hypothetical protein